MRESMWSWLKRAAAPSGVSTPKVLGRMPVIAAVTPKVRHRALADNPGMDELLWQAETRELRQLMIDMGNELQRRGHAHPDMQSWLLAFSNWNQSGL